MSSTEILENRQQKECRHHPYFHSGNISYLHLSVYILTYLCMCVYVLHTHTNITSIFFFPFLQSIASADELGFFPKEHQKETYYKKSIIDCSSKKGHIK